MTTMLNVKNAAKRFVLHNQGAAEIPVFRDVTFSIPQGECVALTGSSGTGKSTFMRMIYANYLCSEGAIEVFHDQQWLDMATASPHEILDIRKRTMGYVSQFLRVIPRVPTLEIVAEPLITLGTDPEVARNKARQLLTRLQIPEHLWSLSPLTFSGGEQQRVNIARSFVVDYPIILLDEPTASLDAKNRQTVLDLIKAARDRGAAILGIFHDEDARNQVANRLFDLTPFREQAA